MQLYDSINIMDKEYEPFPWGYTPPPLSSKMLALKPFWSDEEQERMTTEYNLTLKEYKKHEKCMENAFIMKLYSIYDGVSDLYVKQEDSTNCPLTSFAKDYEAGAQHAAIIAAHKNHLARYRQYHIHAQVSISESMIKRINTELISMMPTEDILFACIMRACSSTIYSKMVICTAVQSEKRSDTILRLRIPSRGNPVFYIVRNVYIFVVVYPNGRYEPLQYDCKSTAIDWAVGFVSELFDTMNCTDESFDLKQNIKEF